MILVRLSKVALIAALGSAFAEIVAFDDIVDYGSDHEFVRHVLSMEHDFPRQRTDAPRDHRRERLGGGVRVDHRHGAIDGSVSSIGALALLAPLTALAAIFDRAKVWAVAGMIGRLWSLVFRLPCRRRGIFRHVAVEGMEWSGGGIPRHDGDPWCAGFGQAPRQRPGVMDLSTSGRNWTGIRLSRAWLRGKLLRQKLVP